MSLKINIVSMSLEGCEITIPCGLSELLSNPSYWSNEEYVKPEFLKSYTSSFERNKDGYLVTTCRKNLSKKEVS